MRPGNNCLLAALLVLTVGACAMVSEPQPPAVAAASAVWPAAPAEPRIRFERFLARPEDLGIRKGFLERLGDLLFGASEQRLVRPMAVLAVGPVLYIADPGAYGVHRFDPARGHDLIRASNDTMLRSTVALARGGGGTVYLTDSALAAVYTIAPGATTAVPLSLTTTPRQPTGIAADPVSGKLYVVDTAAHEVLIFDREGSLRGRFGRRGSADGEFNYPTLIWRGADGRLFVTDSLNFRVQIFDEGGRFLGKFGRYGDGSGDLARHKGVATDSYGHVYVVDALLPALQIFRDDGQLLLSIGGIGKAPGEFWLPTGIYIDEGNMIYVADSHNQRVQIFRYVGGPT